MIAKGYILVMMSIIIFLVPGVSAISYGNWGGGNGHHIQDSTTMNVPDEASASCHSRWHEGTYSESASGSGDLHESYVAFNDNGEIASITADVYRAEDWNFVNDPVSTSDLTSATVDGSDFGLTVNNAKKIECSVGASNRVGDKASAEIEVKRGSLINWGGVASADKLQGAKATQTFDAASGKEIEIDASSSNKERDRAKTWIEVEGIKRHLGSITDFNNGASASETEVSSTQTIGSASGREIELGASSSNKERDRAKTWIEVEGIKRHLGSIADFNNGASASKTEVSSTQTIGSASGKEIELGASSSNKEKDRTEASMTIKDGSISDYSSTASATATTASAQLSNTSPNSVVRGKRIGIESSGSDTARDKTSAYTELKHGAIIGALTNFANVDTATNMLISSQSANDVSGTKIKVHAKAKSNGVKANKDNKLLNPTNSAFHNNANVIAGTPTVGQGFP